ncbi:large subunit of L-aminoadipate-semialdehyde dehydrogenase [Gonapodya prolifera JEL478]|uniref:Alpha-aminoadipate reductase n=1 Tax=Gonapodya prolifera (strain JEL478) TaxID=1344416 RepID=A0A139ARK2_GONPJ|nr:large subunit of L-aminoadipate-semialdehyde dehydrogenase [Gonapodya prolifera JEL478]|eukprot:KXS19367.1 large subunit of L-aminoadipate-semialdehyde dehydrogenase [Gonapodya prolifera JEL478]
MGPVAPTVADDATTTGGDSLDASLERWRVRLSNVTELSLPTDYPRPVPPRVVESEHARNIGEDAAAAVASVCVAMHSSGGAGEHKQNSHNVNGQSIDQSATPLAVVLAAFFVLLHKYSGEEDVAAGWSFPSLEADPNGAQVETSVLRCAIDKSMTFADVVKAVSQAQNTSLSDPVPFSLLMRHLYPQPPPGTPQDGPPPPALMRVRFVESAPQSDQESDQSDTLAAPEPHAAHLARRGSTAGTFAPHLLSDLTVYLHPLPTLRRILPLRLRVRYNAALFTDARIRDMLDAADMLLVAAAKNPSAPIGQLSIATERAQLCTPDPTMDLDWDGWHGAITDVFHKNAEAHPDRVCVVESIDTGAGVGDKPEDCPQRTFSYAQIDRASNRVANYLLKKGLKREDVVTLYSYRGVDLVIAIMGVLKAGGTFSVIDPAYPPQRQTIYLTVAQPRALLILRRAGPLPDAVRTHVRDTLFLACEIPAMELKDNGSVSGGWEGEGAEEATREWGEVGEEFPGVLLGPDSVGTLSFTSGSTGIPKGVRGRHFSLTHFYPWMSMEFGLTEKERFTMLSGIAHDPIQRDIFTPLFLGATLHIPTAEDIGQPGRLAAWMAHHKITVTHLTPAMGQLLSANATTPIPTLRNSFFVGDVLTKRDVARLQLLAPNNAVVNMYGTTETQRAVSYLRVPPRGTYPTWLADKKDIIPAGKGMKDVQILVITPGGLPAGIGEIGEIYVRSGGLAEGYLGLPDATAAKFVANPLRSAPTSTVEIPFYKGPRDRMYRSGDLGRYLPNGEVECTGRADDQVKIRGFRIELGEIDTHLSQCAGVRENVTLVRRDKYEEQTLVSYIVPLLEQYDGSQEEFIKSIREHLKGKLPGYAIPSVFAILRRMPLTPNGKVDKNALPFPDTARFSGPPSSAVPTTPSSLSPVQQQIHDLWAQLIGISGPIAITDNFFDVGGHSILATRLVFELRKAMGVELGLGVVFREPTIEGMAREIERLRSTDFNIVPPGESKAVFDARDEDAEEQTVDYAADLEVLDDPSIAVSEEVLKEFKYPIDPKVVLLTGATGFVGAYVLSTLFKRHPEAIVITHVRAKNAEEAMKRVKAAAEAYGLWISDWEKSGRLQVVLGDLGKENLGLSSEDWERLAKEVDVIIHNGALVHWVYPYHRLRTVNVVSTVDALRLSVASGKVKPIVFVSSTATLDNEYYTSGADQGAKVMEEDDLEGARTGLKAGYGQSKWVSEKLLMKARERGCIVKIVRPGYVLGDSRSGATNTDDFIIRLMKGCIELGKVPEIANVVNMCPVDYVAGSIVAIASDSRIGRDNASMGVFHMWNDNPFRFIDLFRLLRVYGYPVEPCEYIQWRQALMDFTLMASDENSNALFPLLHFVLDDLPTSSKSAILDDSNTKEALRGTDVVCGRMEDLFGRYIAYLVKSGFLPKPTPRLAHTSEASQSEGSASKREIAQRKKNASIADYIISGDLDARELPDLEGVHVATVVARNRN